jgi:uncharacterized membrane protein
MNSNKIGGIIVPTFALIFIVLQNSGVNITPEHYKAYTDVICSILILLGIMSDTTKLTFAEGLSNGFKLSNFKNYKVLLSMASLIFLLICDFTTFAVSLDQYNTVVNLILSILISAGIVDGSIEPSNT